jgi:hypothetical protein
VALGIRDAGQKIPLLPGPNLHRLIDSTAYFFLASLRPLPNAQLAFELLHLGGERGTDRLIACVRLLPCRSIAARIFSTSCPAALTSSASRCKSAASVRNAAMIDSMSAEAIFSGKLVITGRCLLIHSLARSVSAPTRRSQTTGRDLPPKAGRVSGDRLNG